MIFQIEMRTKTAAGKLRLLLCRFFSLALAFAFAFGCGTMVGNPKKPADGGGGEEPEAISLPQIDFGMPESIVNETETGLYLTALTESRYTVLHSSAQRVDYLVKSVNTVLAKLDTEEVKNTGRGILFVEKIGR